MKNRDLKNLLAYVQGSKGILEGKCEGASVTNALLNLDAMEVILKEMRDSPREPVNADYSGDVEYHVDLTDSVTDRYEHMEDAAGTAVMVALHKGEATIDVVVFNKGGAWKYGGDDAVEEFLEDPEASVFNRIELKVNMLGRVP